MTIIEQQISELDDEYDYGNPQTVGCQDRLLRLRDTKGVARLRIGQNTGLHLIPIENGGDNLAATFRRELADITIYFIRTGGLPDRNLA